MYPENLHSPWCVLDADHKEKRLILPYLEIKGRRTPRIEAQGRFYFLTEIYFLKTFIHALSTPRNHYRLELDYPKICSRYDHGLHARHYTNIN